MIGFLKEAFDEVSQLLEDEQRHIVEVITYIFLSTLLIACDLSPFSSSSSTNNHSVSTSSGPITYSARASDVLIRTFYGGGNFGTLDWSPTISIYGDGSYVLGPGLNLRQGKLTTGNLHLLIDTVVDSDGLLALSRQQFYDIPDQNATLLQVSLNNKHYQYLYGNINAASESLQAQDEYNRLGKALSDITNALIGPTSPYTNRLMALLVHQDFSPDLTQTIPIWTLPDFSLDQVAVYECGITPPDLVDPNPDTGCLSFSVPHYAYLPTSQQLQSIKELLQPHGRDRACPCPATSLLGKQQGVFYDQTTGAYYAVTLRPLLPDEIQQNMLAMYGSQEYQYAPIPLHSGPIPTPTPTPAS